MTMAMATGSTSKHNMMVMILSCTVFLATLVQGIQAVQYPFINNAQNSAGSVRFLNDIGIVYSKRTMGNATDFIWSLFQQNTPAQRKPIQTVTLILEYYNGVAYATNGEIHLSTEYIDQFQGDVKKEITGVLYHEMTHIWQWDGNRQAPSGLIEGIADYVRLKANLAPGHWAKPGEGSSWDKGYDVTARFLEYCERHRNGFVAELNEKMKTGYSPDFFLQIMGKPVDQLWAEYKADPYNLIHMPFKNNPHSLDG